MVRIKQLIWDDWNVKHISRHKVSVDEVEEVSRSATKALKSYKRRLIVLDRTRKGRLLTVVLAPEAEGRYYVVTARDIRTLLRRNLDFSHMRAQN